MTEDSCCPKFVRYLFGSGLSGLGMIEKGLSWQQMLMLQKAA